MKGCDLCGDFPASLHARCHPSAPLRAVMEAEGELVLRCYLPDCDREVVRLKVDGKLGAERYTIALGEVHALLTGLYEPDEAELWMKTPQPLLHGWTPARLLEYPGGKNQVLAVLQAVLDSAYL